MILGDHEYGTFQDTIFTAQDERLRGLTLHGQSGMVGGTAVSGVLRGETTTDEIRGDGTSGPYRLEEAPVIEGSEQVRIEIRDRSNPNRVIQRRALARGRDYLMNYDDGEIRFDRPVDESDFRGNPIFIIVTYQFDTLDDKYHRASWGTRLTLTPNDSVQAGVTYLADGPWMDADTSDAWDNRRQIYGADLSVKFTERYKVGIEVAGSEVPEAQEDVDGADAVRLDLDANPMDPLRLYGTYWRVEREFLTFGNLDLQSDNVIDEYQLSDPFYFRSGMLEFDLDPNIYANLGTDEESYGLSAAYDINQYHTVSTGFRETTNNIPDDPESEQLNTRNLFASYQRIHPEWTDWLVGVEVIDSTNDEAPQTLDTTSTRLLGALKYPVGTFIYTGDTYLQFAYQFENFADNLDALNDQKIHDLLGRYEIHPIQEVMAYFEGGQQYLFEEREDDFTRRTDSLMAGSEGIFNRYFDLDVSARYAWSHDLVDDILADTEQIYTLRWVTLPLDVVRARLRLEYRQLDDRIDGRVSDRGIYGGEILWDIIHSLVATLAYEYEDEQIRTPGEPDESITYDDFLVRLDYRFRTSMSLFGGYQLEHEDVMAPPLDDIKTTTTTYLLGAKYRFLERWEMLGAYKFKILEEAIEDERQQVFAELGYWITRFLQIALGYERTLYTDEDTGEEYEANVGYVSLTGKL